MLNYLVFTRGGPVKKDNNQALFRLHELLTERNRNLSIDPAIGFQAEHTMIRIERFLRNGSPKNCVTCGAEISEGRRNACPETSWGVSCCETYDRERGKPWINNARYGKSI